MEGGYAVNLSGDYNTLEVQGEENTSVYHAVIDGKTSNAERRFCKHCASALWLYDSRWPELVHPFASAIDSDLPAAPEHTHLMLGSRAGWVEPAISDADKMFDEYPDESIAQWHQRLGLKS